MKLVVNIEDLEKVYYHGKDYRITDQGLEVLDPETGSILYHVTDINSSNGEIHEVNDADVPSNIDLVQYQYIMGSAGYEFVEFSSPAEDPRNLDHLKQSIVRDIHNYRNNYIASNYIYGGLVFQSDPISIQLLNNATTGMNTLVMMGGNTTIPWTLADNSTVLIAAQEFLDMGLKVIDFVSSCYITARSHKDIVIHDLQTRREILDYDYNNMWWPDRDLGGTLSNTPM